MQWFVLIVIYSHLLAEWCQQFGRLVFESKFKTNPQAEHKNLNMSETVVQLTHEYLMKIKCQRVKYRKCGLEYEGLF